MKRREYDKKVYPKSEIRESCIAGSDCDGVCRAKYYENCTIHAQYYYEYRGKRKAKIFINKEEYKGKR